MDASKVLVIEDEPVVATVCQRVLAQEGFQVDIAADGKTGQQMVRDNRYDLCLVDMKMPVMDGNEFYQWLQEEQPQLASRVIFTTGDVIGENTQTSLQQTERPFLPKPFSVDMLQSLVSQVVMDCSSFA